MIGAMAEQFRRLGMSAQEAVAALEAWQTARGTLAASLEPSTGILDEARAIATTQLLEIRVDRRLLSELDAQVRDELVEWVAIVVTRRGPISEVVRPVGDETVDDAWRRTFAELGVAI